MSATRFFLYGDRTWAKEPCPKRGEGVGHCAHRGAVTYTSNPSQHDETCCFCGETVRVQDAPVSCFGYTAPRPEDHGPHYPRTTVTFGDAGRFTFRAPCDREGGDA